MKTKKIYVPKSIVLRHEIHPESYGESLVVLENGMWTDVYTDENGCLFTLTNDEKLIKYLKVNQKLDEKMVFYHERIKVQSVTNDDHQLLNEWMRQSLFYRYDLVKDSQEIVRRFISQSQTINSHVFIVSNKAKFAMIRYIIIETIAIVHFEKYNQEVITKEDINSSIVWIIEYLKEHHLLTNILFMAMEYDWILNEVNLKLGFIRNSIPNVHYGLNGIHIEYTYEYTL